MIGKSKRKTSARHVLLDPAPAGSGDQAALEKAFFKSICLPNGTHKTTSSGRLTDLDEQLCDLLDPGATLSVLDVGISSGVTTLEMLDGLAARGHRLTAIGLDMRIHAYLRRWMGIDVLYDADGNALQISTPLFTRGRPDLPLATAKARLLHCALMAAERLLVRRWMADPGRSEAVKLLSPRLSGRPGFAAIEHDLRRPFPQWADSFDVIRAANVLNRSYFSTEVLQEMIGRLTGWLRIGGLLVLCRTDEGDGGNHATIFRKGGRDGTLSPARRLGSGSELESLMHLEAIA